MDVFVSYASEDRERARQLAAALEAQGWSVWWDRKILAGQSFDQTIEHELEIAHAVVVLWSKASIHSEWVRNEAAAAAERGVLVPVLVDNVRLPLEFRRKQAADLIGWTGDTSQAGWLALCEGIAAKAERSAAATAPALTRSGGPPRRWNRRWAVLAVTSGTAALGFGTYRSGVFTPALDRLSPVATNGGNMFPAVVLPPLFPRFGGSCSPGPVRW